MKNVNNCMLVLFLFASGYTMGMEEKDRKADNFMLRQMNGEPNSDVFNLRQMSDEGKIGARKLYDNFKKKQSPEAIDRELSSFEEFEDKEDDTSFADYGLSSSHPLSEYAGEESRAQLFKELPFAHEDDNK